MALPLPLSSLGFFDDDSSESDVLKALPLPLFFSKSEGEPDSESLVKIFLVFIMFSEYGLIPNFNLKLLKEVLKKTLKALNKLILLSYFILNISLNISII